MMIRHLAALPYHPLVALLLIVLGSHSSLNAQSPLEKLENKLRNKLPEAEVVPPPPAEDQLPGPGKTPAPKTDSKDGPNLTDPGSPLDEAVYLGLEVQSLGADEIGVLITEVIDKSPAWKAGLMVGDRLLGYNGEAIDGIENFGQRLTKTKPGDTIRFIVDRNGRNMAVPVVAQRFELAERLGNVPRIPPESLGIPGPIGAIDDSRAWLGCSVADLSEAWRRQFTIPAFRGAAISDVVAGSPAAVTGLKPGDVIIEIGGRSIESARDLTQWLSETRPGTVAKVSYFRGLTAKVGEVTVGAISGANEIPDRNLPIQDLSRPNLEGLPVADQVEYLRAEIFDMQQRLLELQRELDRLQRSVGPPK